MKFYVSRKMVYSHLDPVGGPILASREASRMRAWLKLQFALGRQVTFLDLTYDIKAYTPEQTESAAHDCYEKAKVNKHVSRFFKRVEEHTGVSLRGRWRAKMEFQKNGFLHFHVLISEMPYVKKAVLDEIWGHGFTWVRRAKMTHAAYIAKYQSKQGSYPPWLYDKPRRSVKIWGTSPGFWKELEELEAKECLPSVGEHQPLTLYDDHMKEVRADRNASRQAFVDALGLRDQMWEAKTVGEQIESAMDTVIIRDENGESCEAQGIDQGTMNVVLACLKAKYDGNQYGMTRWESHWNEMNRAIQMCATFRRLMDSEKQFANALEFYASNPETDPTGPPAGSPRSGVPESGGSLTLFKYQVREDQDPEPEFLPYDPDLYDDEIPF